MERLSAIDRLGPKLPLVWAGLQGRRLRRDPSEVPGAVALAWRGAGRRVAHLRHLQSTRTGVDRGAGPPRFCSQHRRRWYALVSLPAGIVLAEAFWLLSALDLRVAAILAGRPAFERSGLHAVYIAAECPKILALVGAGLRDPVAREAQLFGRRAFLQFR